MKLSITIALSALIYLIVFSYSSSKFMKKNPTSDQVKVEKEKLKKNVKKNVTYVDFYKQLNNSLSDNKQALKKAINELVENNKVHTTQKNISIEFLRPTQNEIGMNESLYFPLTNSTTAKSYLYCGETPIIVKAPILTLGGNYIIDGHHRWSQVYALNPKCFMTAIDIQNITEPMAALKATQMGIVAHDNVDKIPSSNPKGVNLLDSTVSANQVMDEIEKITTDEVLAIFTGFQSSLKNKKDVATYIWGNIENMRKNNKPADGAPLRIYMPQTDQNTIEKTMNVEKISKKKKF